MSTRIWCLTLFDWRCTHEADFSSMYTCQYSISPQMIAAVIAAIVVIMLMMTTYGIGLTLMTTTDASWSGRAGRRMSTSPGRSRSVTGYAGSRAVAPSRRRAGDRSSSEATPSVTRSDYRRHLIVTASVGGCMLVFNVTLFFCLYCHRRVRRHFAFALFVVIY